MTSPPGLDRARWGPALWAALHAMSVAGDPAAVRDILRALPNALPCASCREHVAAHLAARPPAFRTPAEAALYVFRLHNAVNASLGSPDFPAEAFELHFGAGSLGSLPLPPPPPPPPPRRVPGPAALARRRR